MDIINVYRRRVGIQTLWLLSAGWLLQHGLMVCPITFSDKHTLKVKNIHMSDVFG